LACLLHSPTQGYRFKSSTIKIVRHSARFARGIAMEADMATGTVKWFNPTKGFGFIQPESGDKDVFVHISAVEKAGMSTLTEGQRVSYEVINEKGRSSAGNLQAV
jgi:CspA family cold shock protein